VAWLLANEVSARTFLNVPDAEAITDGFPDDDNAVNDRGSFSACPPRIGRYRVDRELGRGGMGVVYAAYDDQLERPVAIKMLAQSATDALSRKRLWREARAGARIRHPNVCHLYEIAEDDEPFPVMELLEGKSLAERLARGPLPFNEAITIALATLAALEVLHGEGLIHG
jgi:eukaryotic-like serine/threonine-protein kinase